MPRTDTKQNENPEPANSPIAKLTDGREGKNSIDNPVKMNPAIGATTKIGIIFC